MGLPPSPQPGDQPNIGPPVYHPPQAPYSPPPPGSAPPPGFGQLPPTAPPASVGLFVVLAGVLATAVGLAALDWITWDEEFARGSEGATLNGVAGLFVWDETRDVLGSFEHTYLQYLSWLTAAAAMLTALLATLPQGAAGPRSWLRGMATVLGAFGVLGTILLAVALQDLADEEGSGGFELSAGPWVTAGGLALLALGGLLGPNRSR